MIETREQHVVAVATEPAARVGDGLALRVAYLPWLVLLAFAFTLGLFNLRDDVALLFGPFVYRRDFVAIYGEIRAIAAGHDPFEPVNALALRYLGIVTQIFEHPTPHPPTMALFFIVPFAWLNYKLGAIVWFLLQLACLVSAIPMLHALVGRRPNWRLVPLLVVVAAAWYPVQDDLIWSNFSLIELFLLLGTCLALRKERPTLAGGLLGVALLVKPIAWPVLLALVLKRQWRAAVSAMLVGSVGWAITAVVVGISRLPTYLTTDLPGVTRIYQADFGNTSLSALAWHLFTGGTAQWGTAVRTILVSYPVILSVPAAQIGSVLLPAVAVGLFALVAARWLSVTWSVALAIALSTVINPISWEHENVLLLIPIVMLVDRLVAQGRRTRLAVAATAAIILLPLCTQSWITPIVLALSPTSGATAAALSPYATMAMNAPTFAVIVFAVVLSLYARTDST